jgi:hypothetical protein
MTLPLPVVFSSGGRVLWVVQSGGEAHGPQPPLHPPLQPAPAPEMARFSSWCLGWGKVALIHLKTWATKSVWPRSLAP